MNENFRFLASEMKEKSVHCNNGQSITDAINDGFNVLTIYGTCDGGFMVYMLDPSPFGVSFSQMLNKPISHLIIKGGDSNRAAKIVNTSDGMKSQLMSNGFLQLYNLTFNDSLNIVDGSVLMLNEVNYESLNLENDEYSRIGISGNSFTLIKDSIISAQIEASENSNVIIEKSNLNAPSGDDYVLEIEKNSHLETEEVNLNGKTSLRLGSSWDEDYSTINCIGSYSCINLKSSYMEMDGTTVNGTLSISNNSSASLWNTTINGDSNDRTIKVTHNSNIQINGTSSIIGHEGVYNTIWLWNNSSADISGASTITAPTGVEALNLQQNSGVILNGNPIITSVNRNSITLDTNSSLEINDNANINRTDSNADVYVDATSSVNINSNSTWDGEISCGAITSHVSTGGGNTNINISNTCNGTGYSPIFFTYTDFPDANCGKMGLQDLNESQCSNFQPNQGTVCDGGQLPGCWYDSTNGYWLYNNCGDTTSYLNTIITAVACKNFTFNN